MTITYEPIVFQCAFEKWFKQCDGLYQDDRRKKLGYHLDYKFGRKYIKVLNNTGNQTGAWAFVELETGNIYKPADWRKPAKHARGNIFDKDGGMKYMQWTGPMYMGTIKEMNKKTEDWEDPRNYLE
jgi:hypothetical protein